MIERRRRRSAVMQEALTLYLEAAAARSGAAAAALATSDGLLLSGAGGGHDLDGLAALGAERELRSPGDPWLDARIQAATGGEDLHTARVTVRGEPFYLASIGARLGGRRELAEDLDRILGPRL
ncbi:MAG: hypothetical protein IT372_28370 [Polyangiaceae bacterium]|nr:hypothetical protein [Polyangiaceae bacterium]